MKSSCFPPDRRAAWRADTKWIFPGLEICSTCERTLDSKSFTGKSGRSCGRRFCGRMSAKLEFRRRGMILTGQIVLGLSFVLVWQKLVDLGKLDEFFFS